MLLQRYLLERCVVAMCLLFICSSIPLSARALTLRSANHATTTVELYTSEGCSSCPNADAWLSSLKRAPNLFSQFIPIAFHVDYWDQLGWQDRFALPGNTRRQRDMSRIGMVSQVYTPGFVVNSREWRGWFSGGSQVTANQLPVSDRTVGVLRARWPEGAQMLTLSFTPDSLETDNLQLHIAIVGMGLKTDVRHGENKGRLLHHDFVVLSHGIYPFGDIIKGTIHKRVTAPDIPDRGQDASVLVVWVSGMEQPDILQAVAGYLDW
ncbi:Uncharacterised protein [Zhongshania aliphaticivorans]|uniref:DUF1223 domain-containing protein n=1 Tax=Zhongshania aliphaticivorans TaxID=1470434 RepID=A0A5S9Q5T3_9GAMM|nr:DUF1223 domain-containing protein [Zhongshania aliphaticivorans]CAA0094932.1 Uncharacterised protein [Zhongshania aliphaticivorans]CAA0112764.1 Uncharacterised protein [Zhongshania aliphaticivorans]